MRSAESIHGSTSGTTSEWLCTSTKPGDSARPRASIRRADSGSSAPSRPSHAMRSPATPTEPSNAGAPVPSTIDAPAIRRSSTGRMVAVRGIRRGTAGQVGEGDGRAHDLRRRPSHVCSSGIGIPRPRAARSEGGESPPPQWVRPSALAQAPPAPHPAHIWKTDCPHRTKPTTKGGTAMGLLDKAKEIAGQGAEAAKKAADAAKEKAGRPPGEAARRRPRGAAGVPGRARAHGEGRRRG